MYNVQFKFIRGQRVRVVTGLLKGQEGEVRAMTSWVHSRLYEVQMDDLDQIDPRDRPGQGAFKTFTEDDLELVDQPVDLTQPAEVEAAKVGS